ncbi:zinc finger protein 58-like [Phlebotomus argentipes]|uniref:zinc finger protein 58-like n=1 Tax=Phlebotomus argentipes TaxID=94469 RepID=UPI0028935B4B|nr:zinc finger protein 58-like [Phlebotomus argentipes]
MSCGLWQSGRVRRRGKSPVFGVARSSIVSCQNGVHTDRSVNRGSSFFLHFLLFRFQNYHRRLVEYVMKVAPGDITMDSLENLYDNEDFRLFIPQDHLKGEICDFEIDPFLTIGIVPIENESFSDILAIDVKPLDYIPKEDTPQNEYDWQYLLRDTPADTTTSPGDAGEKKEAGAGEDFHCWQCMKPHANKLVLRAHLKRHLKASQFKCKLCNLTFRYAGKLVEHLASHPEVVPLKCPVCKAVHVNLKELKDHVNTHEKLQICDLCGKNFCSRKSLRDHLRLHSGDKPYKCEDCDKTFATASHLSSHRRIHKTAKLHKCEKCGTEYTRSYDLKKHTMKNCENAKANSMMKKKAKGKSSSVVMPCPCCTRNQDNAVKRKLIEDYLMRHKIFNSYKCRYCELTFYNPNEFLQHEMFHTGKFPLYCMFCNDICESQELPEVTGRNHKTRLLCDVCGNLHRRKNTLVGDQVGKENTESPMEKIDFTWILSQQTPHETFRCPECGKTFLRKHLFKVHAKRHKIATQYKCEYCNLAFRYASQLVVHILEHPEKVTLQCPVCGDFFQSQEYLESHVLLTHENVLVCETCGKSFRSDNSLRNHTRTHTGFRPYECPECGKKFTTSSHLSSHRRTHRTQKQFKCEECNSMFTRETHLRRHILGNKCKGLEEPKQKKTPPKRLKCSSCPQRFASKKDLQQHIDNMHNNSTLNEA